MARYPGSDSRSRLLSLDNLDGLAEHSGMITVAIQEKLGFIGAGRMVKALVKGFGAAGLVPPYQVIASDVYETARAALQEETGTAAIPRKNRPLFGPPKSSKPFLRL